MVEFIERTNCILNDSKLESLHTFHRFPIRMGVTSGDDYVAEMKFGVSSCGLVQLTHLIDPKLLYNNFHNPGAIGKTWWKHHKSFSNFIKRSFSGNVLEIGGSSGNLSNYFKDVKNPYTIIDPDENCDSGNIHYLKGFFEDYNFDVKYDTIIHSHTLEHIYDPKKFLSKIRELLTDDGKMFISIPNMQYWLQNNFVNTLHFEHTFYIDFKVLKNLLSLTGFSINSYEIGTHSIFVECSKTEISNKIADFGYVKLLFEAYIQKLEEDIFSIRSNLEKYPQSDLFLFGANIFSQMYEKLLQGNFVIESILDNDPSKQNNKLYGTNYTINSPEILKNYVCPIVLLRAGVYNQEIKKQLILINPTTIFI